MADLQTRFDRLWTGQDSTRSAQHHPFAHLDVLEEVSAGVGFYKGFVNLCVVDTDDGAVLIDTGAFASIFHEASFAAVRGWFAQQQQQLGGAGSELSGRAGGGGGGD